MTPAWTCPWCGMKVDVGRQIGLNRHANEECPRRPTLTDDNRLEYP